MICEITKIHEYKKSQKEGVYMMIEMTDEKTRKWYRTYLVPGYRNCKKWRRIAREGNKIHFRNLIMETEDIINADSDPIFFSGRRTIKTAEEETLHIKSLAEEKVFG